MKKGKKIEIERERERENASKERMS